MFVITEQLTLEHGERAGKEARLSPWTRSGIGLSLTRPACDVVLGPF